MKAVDEAWAQLVDGIRSGGDRIAALTADLDDAERGDGYQALLRAVNNQLSRFETDRAQPELVFFNGWREKYFMDNPDFRYWVADIAGDRRYEISGTIGDSVYQSVTVYATDGTVTTASARIDSTDLDIDADGRFAITLSVAPPDRGNWLPLPEDAAMVWVRHFHTDVSRDRLGECRIDVLDAPGPAPRPDPGDIARRLRRLSRAVTMLPDVFAASWKAEAATPNRLRHWSEMRGGAAFTEPGIHYLRGSWRLEPGEALLLEGPVVPCRYWNILLYSRYLNSLDFRTRSVSRTSGTARLHDGRYRFVIADRDPQMEVDWLDTEGRPFGLIVMRWLHPEGEVPLPEVRKISLKAYKEKHS